MFDMLNTLLRSFPEGNTLGGSVSFKPYRPSIRLTPAGRLRNLVSLFTGISRPDQRELYFAMETFARHPDLPETAWLDGNARVAADRAGVFSRIESMEEAAR
jgi:hypothetical protein